MRRPPPAPRRGGENGALSPPCVGSAEGQRALCRIDEIPDGGSKGFPPPGGFTGLFAVRQGDAVYVYVNSCPHIGTPLDWMPDRFLSADGSLIICATHGAEFRIADGECLRGPCFGDRLERVVVRDQGRHHIRARGCRPLASRTREGTRSCQMPIRPTDRSFRSGPRSPRRRTSPPRAIRTCSSAPHATPTGSGPSSRAASPG